MTAIDDLVRANERLATGGGALPPTPASKVAIVTCMDARMVPARIFGLEEGDVHVIRNAGGVAKEALRSLVISQRLLGTNAIMVLHHTECGMLALQNEEVHVRVKDDLGTDSSHIDFMPFADLEQSVRDDVDFLKSSPLIADESEIRGFVYDLSTGRVREVA